MQPIDKETERLIAILLWSIAFAALVSVVLCLSGCKAVEYFGAVSMETYNGHIEEIEDFSKQALTNQGDIGTVAQELAQENIYEAKADNDDAKLERSIGTRVRAEIATKKANKLAEVEFKRGETPSMDWGNILQMILTGLGAAFPALGGILFMMKGKLNRVTEKAKHFASKSESFDVSHDKDFK